MAYGLTASDYLLAGVVFLIFVTAVAALVYVGWRISKQKGGE